VKTARFLIVGLLFVTGLAGCVIAPYPYYYYYYEEPPRYHRHRPYRSYYPGYYRHYSYYDRRYDD